VRWIVLAAVVLVLGATGAAARWTLVRLQRARECEQHLHQIYLALEWYQAQHGELPHLAMYPAEKYAPDSLIRCLKDMGFPEELALCPESARLIRERGVSYLWNPRLNGLRLGSVPRTWMLVEINALEPQTYPKPHFGAYQVLFTDGTVRRTKRPPWALAAEK